MKKSQFCPSCGSPEVAIKKGDLAVSGRPRYKCKTCGYRTTSPLSDPPEAPQRFMTTVPKSKVYVFTSAQNASKVHAGFLASLIHYQVENSASLTVIQTRYRNPTSLASRKSDEWWAESLHPYLFAGRANLNNNITVLGDIKVQPTAVDPLSGLHGISGHMSAVVGHAKIALHTVAAPSHRLPKILVTTGSVTRPNYTESKAGKKGEFHHSFGAVVIEVVDDETFYVRHLNAQADGSFIDWDKKYTRRGVEKAKPALGLIMGDAHLTFLDPEVKEGTFGKGGIIDETNPGELVWHDSLDSFSITHHHRKNPIAAVAKHRAGLNDGMMEVTSTLDAMVGLTKRWPKMRNIVVPSNHDEHLSRWVHENDWRTDPVNAEFYLETALAMVKSANVGDARILSVDPFKWWAERLMHERDLARFKFLARGEQHEIGDIEVGYHGDKGPGGSRGSAMQYRNIGAKTIIGHSHTPKIVDGCYQVGTSSRLKLDYNTGPPQTWLHCHCIVYANGKRSLLIMISGKAKA